MKRGLKGNAVALVLGLTLFLACGTVYASETEQTPTVQTETEQLDTYTETVTNAVNTADTAAVSADTEAPDDNQIDTSKASTVESAPDSEVTPVSETEMKQGWDEAGTMYYVDDQPVVGEKKIDNAWYYFDENGVKATGWTVQAGKPDKQYYYDSDGKMHYEWLQDGDTWYYFHPVTGVMQVNTERKINGSYYYFNENGVMATGWTQHHDHTYYYQPDGRMT